MSDSDKPATCPVCGAQTAKRQLSTFAAQGGCGPAGNGGGFT